MYRLDERLWSIHWSRCERSSEACHSEATQTSSVRVKVVVAPFMHRPEIQDVPGWRTTTLTKQWTAFTATAVDTDEESEK